METGKAKQSCTTALMCGRKSQTGGTSQLQAQPQFSYSSWIETQWRESGRGFLGDQKVCNIHAHNKTCKGHVMNLQQELLQNTASLKSSLPLPLDNICSTQSTHNDAVRLPIHFPTSSVVALARHSSGVQHHAL